MSHRSFARNNLSVENTTQIRHNDSEHRSLARSNFPVENTTQIRDNDTGSRIIARTDHPEIQAANQAVDANSHVTDRLLNSEESQNRVIFMKITNRQWLTDHH